MRLHGEPSVDVVYVGVGDLNVVLISACCKCLEWHPHCLTESTDQNLIPGYVLRSAVPLIQVAKISRYKLTLAPRWCPTSPSRR